MLFFASEHGSDQDALLLVDFILIDFTVRQSQFNIIQMSFEKLDVFGKIPLPRFGHSATLYAENKVCLFGGATGNTGQFSITDNTYTFDLTTRFWRKV